MTVVWCLFLVFRQKIAINPTIRLNFMAKAQHNRHFDAICQGKLDFELNCLRRKRAGTEMP